MTVPDGAGGGRKGPLVGVPPRGRASEDVSDRPRLGRPERIVIVRPVDRAGDVTYALSNALALG